MDNWFKSRWFVRAISLAFAIGLYVFVQVEIDQYQNDSRLLPNSGDDAQTVEDVPVNIRIDEENYVVSGVPEAVAVTLEGSTGTLTATAQQENFDIYVDLENLEPGTHTVDLEYTGIPEELKVYIEPKTIEVTIEERVSEQFNVAVDVINMDQLPKGYQVGDSRTEPDQVTITSSKEVIEQIAIVKVFVDVSETAESIDNREVPVNVYDARGNELNVRVEPENVNASVDINNPSKNVPVNVETTGELSNGYSLSSISPNADEVKVFGPNEVLQNIEQVSTEAVELSDLTESGTIDVELDLPNGASVPDSESVEVQVELEQTRTFEAVPIDVGYLGDGQDISFTEPGDQKMNVTVTGNQAEVSGLTAADFNVSIDAEGLEAGEHEVPVIIEGPDGIEMNGEFEQAVIDISS
ncbi:CdaA regulatory protein CdaR [Lentibacillus kapialis]|uniref:CdaA regulatory protein CdaR n=1 Tax=Lentibacillus kapialis TaxID=340214 RepID=A0A917UXT5_9BACI|nr:CdaR family protein [Lentibacillus kapialis]GGJ96049.1 CdaA regulatory protein CdaR [Lentibacillus kapialis]